MRQVDVKGSCLFAIFIILFVYNTSQIDFCLGWLTTTPIVLLNLVTMLTFLYVESQIESDEESLVPVRQAVRPEVWPLLLLSFLTIGAQSGILLSITKYVQVVGKHQPKLFDFDMRTILLSSLWVGEGLSAILAGTFSMKTPKSRWWGFLLAAVVFSACLGYMLLKWDGSQGWPAKILPVATAGCATGIFNYLFINLLKESSEEAKGILYGVLHLLGSLGAILTLCVLNQIHNNRKILAWYMKSRLPPKYDIEKLVKDCSENLDTCVDSVNKGDQDIVRQCFTDAIMLGFGVLLVVYIAILALVFTLPSKERATSLSLQDARSGREEN
ncbi:hypothetical protein BJ875DRAFT_145893 [Amylocarpus encephaloides]|uniref:Uncharacterized protein n=1 Tax=Amylocarpus encephaloides TaxID=45428 RepID=A0A9P7YTG4_9HELO|nr:hypothetical protein BJ875DRAFT_145893 [Amylocarpus encephaloides]